MAHGAPQVSQLGGPALQPLLARAQPGKQLIALVHESAVHATRQAQAWLQLMSPAQDALLQRTVQRPGPQMTLLLHEALSHVTSQSAACPQLIVLAQAPY